MSSQAEFGFNIQFGLMGVKNAELSLTALKLKAHFKSGAGAQCGLPVGLGGSRGSDGL